MNWIKNYVGNLHIVHNGRYRGDCPLCGRVNTFSVTDTGFERLWYCFHADCHAKGSTGVQLTKENSKAAFKEKVTSIETNDEFEIPDTFVSLSRSKQAEEYVKRVGSYEAYLSGLADIRYDLQQDRVVYLVKSISNLAVGISLMGTSLLDEHIDVIKQFKKVYIALDKDATGKAILMMKKLRNYVPTKLIVLNKDLKDMQIGERNEFIRRYID